VVRGRFRLRPNVAPCAPFVALLVCPFILAAGRPWFDQITEGRSEVEAAARKLIPFLAETPPLGLEEHFTHEFLNAIPVKDLREVLYTVRTQHGAVTGVQVVRLVGPFDGEVEFTTPKAVRVPARITLERQPPHRIAGLLFRSPHRASETFDDVREDLRRLPGRVGSRLRRLAPDPMTLLVMNNEESLAVGSSFKLLVFAALVDDVLAGRRTWADIVTTRKNWSSLPAGIVQDWPEGSPVTLHTLATLMVSRSDNSATDHLLFTLGRERVEAVQTRLGVRQPERNQPFLATSEMFKIKLALNPEQAGAYVKADAAERRRLLATVVRPAALDRPRLIASPVLIDSVEWFLSADDLCGIMDWFRRGPSQEARDLLAVTKPFDLDDTDWPYVGYKGGAEVGVLNLTLLLKHRSGAWYALAMTWNNPKADVDKEQLVALAQRLVGVLSKGKNGK
jgi:beta-lactamase class A